MSAFRIMIMGDEEALNKLTTTNLRFVVSVAKQYQNQGISLQDLINEGNVGLIKAARRFDETRGFKFISYAVWWIRQAILQAIADQSRIVRLPLNQVGVINKIKKEIARLEQELKRVPTTEEIAESINMPVHKVSEIMKMNNHPQSIDSPISPNEETRFVDIFVHDNDEDTDTILMQESLASEIHDSHRFPPVEKTVASGTGAHTHALVFLLGRKAEIFCTRSRGHDECLCFENSPVIQSHLERTRRRIHRSHITIADINPETHSLLAHRRHQFIGIHTVCKTREIGHKGCGGKLTSRLEAFHKKRSKTGTYRIDCSSITGGTSPYYQAFDSHCW